MSYDLVVYKEIHKANYTSNVFKILTTAAKTLDEKGIYKFHNHWTDPLMYDSRRYLALLIQELEANREKYLPLEPSNGWGNLQGTIEWLSKALEALQQDDSLEIEVTW